MPTRDQVDSVRRHIEDVIGRRYIEGDGDMCSCWFQPEGGGPVGVTVFQGVPEGTPEPFDQIPDKAKVELLTTYVGWEGFDYKQESEVIQRVLDGQDRDCWMDGIEAVDRAGLKGERHHETHHGVEREHSDGDDFPSPEGFRRLLQEMRDDESQRPLHEKGVRYEDEYDRRLDEAAERGKYGVKESDRGQQR